MPSGGGVGCSRLGTCKRQKAKSPPKSVENAAPPTFEVEEKAAAEAPKLLPSAAAAAAPPKSRSPPRVAAAEPPKSKTKKKKKKPAAAAAAPAELPLLGTYTAENNNGNGWENVVETKPKTTKEEKEALKAEERSVARLIGSQKAEHARKYKQSLLTGYAKTVAQAKPAPMILRRPSVAPSAASRRPSVASSTASRRSSAASRRSSAASRRSSTASRRSSTASRRSSTASRRSSTASRRSSTASRRSSTASRRSSTASRRSSTASRRSSVSTTSRRSPTISRRSSIASRRSTVAAPAPISAAPLIPEVKPMTLPSFQKYVFDRATAINKLINSTPIINELAAAVQNPNVRSAIMNPIFRPNIFRFMLKGSTAVALISEHIPSLYWLHGKDEPPLPFPFTSSSDADFSLLVNPDLSDHDFTVIREILVKSIINVLYNKLLNVTDQEEIAADIQRLGYERDTTFHHVHVIRHPQIASDTPALKAFYDEPRKINENSYVTMRIVENNSQRDPPKSFNYSIIRLISRTKKGMQPKSFDMFDIMIPAKSYERFEFEWAYTSDYILFKWPEPNFEFMIYGPIALYFEISHAMLENFTDEKLAAIVGEEFRLKRLQKRARWETILRTLKTMIYKIRALPRANSILSRLDMFAGQTISGVDISTIISTFMSPNEV